MSRPTPAGGQLRKLFAGRDAGHYTLPGDLDDLLEAADHLRELPLPISTVADARERLMAGVDKAARTRGALPSVKELAAAVAAEKVTVELARTRDEVAERLDRELAAAVATRVDEIIVEHLRPAMEDTLAAAAEAVKVTGGVLDLGGLVYASQEAREAAAGFDVLVSRYAAVRGAREQVVRIQGGQKKDVGNYFAELKNMKKIWPQIGAHQGHGPPWPQDPAGRLVWLVTSEAEPYMPTVAEQDDHFARLYPTEADRQAQYRRGQLVNTHE